MLPVILPFAVSGGFATVQPGSKLSINAVEGAPIEDFSAEAIRSQLQEAQKIASGNGSEQDIAEAKIEIEVCYNSPWLLPNTPLQLLTINKGPRESASCCTIEACSPCRSRPFMMGKVPPAVL